MSLKQPVAFPAPQTSAPVEEGEGRIIMTMGGKRYEMVVKVQARELPEAPAAAGIVIEMPKAEQD